MMGQESHMGEAGWSSGIDWVNTSFLAAVHLFGIVAVFYFVFGHFLWKTIILSFCVMLCSSFSMTAGYHRLFSHRSYECGRLLKVLFLVFGAATFQNSVRVWATMHRLHHRFTDTPRDPYSIKGGFWWAHVGWVICKSPKIEPEREKDLDHDPLVTFQDRYYVPLGIIFGFALPMTIASMWGDVLGAFLIAGFFRLLIQYHVTFSVNSFAHYFGSQPYSTETSARNSWITAFTTLGEGGGHNLHHTFPSDYRNGVRLFDLDLTKWFIWLLAFAGLARNLRRTPAALIAAARKAVLLQKVTIEAPA